MANRLPDEIIKEILSPALHVPDKMFADTSAESPFCLLPSPSSAFLEVCKSWLRVATPLLYRVVIIRSKAQAQALERALNANEQFGVMIKKIRVECGYGVALRTILYSAPNVTDLWLSLNLQSNEYIYGIRDGLSILNPTRVILFDSDHAKDHGPARELTKILARCFKTWSKLTSVHLSWRYGNTRSKILVPNMVASPSLKTVYIASISVPYHRGSYLEELSTSTSIQTIYVDAKVFADKYFIDYINNVPKLKKKLMAQEKEYFEGLDIAIGPPVHPSYTPLSHASNDVRDMIWSRVLRFAMYVDTENCVYLDISAMQKLEANLNQVTFLSVSKLFKRLSLPYLYEYPIITSVDALTLFSTRIINDPSLASYIRSLHFRGLRWLPSCNKTLQQILSRSPRLIQLKSTRRFSSDIPSSEHTACLDGKGFEILGNIAGTSLVDIQNLIINSESTDSLRLTTLNQFKKLRFLRCSVQGEFNADLKNIPVDALSSLETLELEDDTSLSFLDVFSQMDLNSLKTVKLPPRASQRPISFLEKHGFKIVNLNIVLGDVDPVVLSELCKNLVVLTIAAYATLTSKYFTAHPTLRKIIIPGSIYQSPSIKSLVDWWPTFFQSVNFSQYPALREFEIQYCQWPTTEHEIPKSTWPRCSDLLAKWNVKLVDRQGRHWRTRTKLVKSGR